MSRRAGFTLVELLVGLVALAVFATALIAILGGASRVAQRAAAALAAERASQALRVFLRQELRDGFAADLSVVTPARVALPRPVGDATPCAVSDSSLLLPESAWSGDRMPEAGRDDAWMLLDAAAEVWQPASIAAVLSDRCPADGSPAIRIDVDGSAAGALVVRVMEPVILSAYRSGTFDWFGLAPAGGGAVVQPFAGPLAPGTTRWSLAADRLETVMQPAGSPLETVATPLRPAP